MTEEDPPNNEIKIELSDKEREAILEKVRKMFDFSEIMEPFTKNISDSLSTMGPIIDFSEVMEPFTKNISDSLSTMGPLIDFSKIMAPVTTKIFESLSSLGELIREIFPIELLERISHELNSVRKVYIVKLIHAFTIFKRNLYHYSYSKNKILIVYSEYLLFLSSIFENYIKEILLILRNEEWKTKYSDQFKSEIEELYEPAELGFYKLYDDLFDQVNFIKHEDDGFYKKYEGFTKEEILEEASDFYNRLKTYIKKSTETFFLIEVIQYHSS